MSHRAATMSQQIRTIVLTLLLVAYWVAPSLAQVVNWGNAGTGDWELAGNWTEPGPPLTEFGEVAVISNGGTAFVDGSSADTGGIVLGNGSGETGALEIRSGGSLTVVSNPGLPTSGTISVGIDGTGLLTILRGGTLETGGLNTAGAGGSLLTLGAGGSGTATLTVNGLTEFHRTTRIIGPNISLTTQDLALGTANLLVAEITGNTHSTISATSGAILRGTLELDFNGYVPLIGDSWDIIDAGSLTGSFATTRLASGDALADGLGLLVSNVAGGANGNLARVTVSSKLVLTVNRTTGQVTMGNIAGGSIDFDGYEIGSASGALSAASWNSLEDQSQPGWLEIGSPNANLLAELNANGSTVATGGTSFDLGNIYQFAPSAIGETDNVSFNYSLSSGQVVDGIVKLAGNENNLVLVVDPTTGDAVLQNQSPFTIGLDGYEVASSGGSLNTTGWDSLQDNPAEGGWFEIGAPTSNLLAELNPDGARTLSSGDQLALGNLFTALASEDLALQFSLATGEILSGIVQYGQIPLAQSADFNTDTFVNGVDLGIWETGYGLFNGNAQNSDGDADHDGFVGGRDFLIWQRQFDGGGGSIAAVPEPASLTLLLASVLGVLL